MTETPQADAAPVDNHPCAVCGQLDNHPMIHVMGEWRGPIDEDGRSVVVANPSFHFDCMPDDQIEKYGLNLGLPQHANFEATRKAALDGTHGDELRAHIASLPSDNEVVNQGGQA